MSGCGGRGPVGDEAGGKGLAADLRVWTPFCGLRLGSPSVGEVPSGV